MKKCKRLNYYRCPKELEFDLKKWYPMLWTYDDLKKTVEIPKKPSPQYSEEEEKFAKVWAEVDVPKKNPSPVYVSKEKEVWEEVVDINRLKWKDKEQGLITDGLLKLANSSYNEDNSTNKLLLKDPDTRDDSNDANL